MLIPVEVVGVRIEMPSNQPIVLLKEIDGSRFLPIWVGAALPAVSAETVPSGAMVTDKVEAGMAMAGSI